MHVSTDWTSVYTLIQKSFAGGGVRTHVNSKGEKKKTSTGKILIRGGPNPRRCIKQDSEPKKLPMSYCGPVLFLLNDMTRNLANRGVGEGG